MTHPRDQGMAVGDSHSVTIGVTKRPDYSYHVTVSSTVERSTNPLAIVEVMATATDVLLWHTAEALVSSRQVSDWATAITLLVKLAEKRKVSQDKLTQS